MEDQNTIILNGKSLKVDLSLKAFSIHERESNTVAYFGTDAVSKRLYVQFKGGKGYVYNDVPAEILNASNEAESIGKFVNTTVVGKFEFVKIDVPLINPITE